MKPCNHHSYSDPLIYPMMLLLISTTTTNTGNRLISSFLEMQTTRKDNSQSAEATHVIHEESVPPLYLSRCTSKWFRQFDKNQSYQADCEPRPTVLKIHKSGSIWSSFFTTIYRCAGRCQYKTNSAICVHAAVESVLLPLIPESCKDMSKPCPETCGRVQLHNHTRCKCSFEGPEAKYFEFTAAPSTGNSPKKENEQIASSHIAKTQNTTNEPCNCGPFFYSLISMTILTTTFLITTAALTLRSTTHQSTKLIEKEDHDSHLHNNISTTSTDEELKIDWKFLPEQSLENGTTMYKKVRYPPRPVVTQTGGTPEGITHYQNIDTHSSSSDDENQYEIIEFKEISS